MSGDDRRVRLAALHHGDLLREIAGPRRSPGCPKSRRSPIEPKSPRSKPTKREAEIIAAYAEEGSMTLAGFALGISRQRVHQVVTQWLAPPPSKGIG